LAKSHEVFNHAVFLLHVFVEQAQLLKKHFIIIDLL